MGFRQLRHSPHGGDFSPTLQQATTRLRMQEFITADTAVLIEIFVPMSSGPLKLLKITLELGKNSQIISRRVVGLVLIYISPSVFFLKNS